MRIRRGPRVPHVYQMKPTTNSGGKSALDCRPIDCPLPMASPHLAGEPASRASSVGRPSNRLTSNGKYTARRRLCTHMKSATRSGERNRCCVVRCPRLTAQTRASWPWCPTSTPSSVPTAARAPRPQNTSSCSTPARRSPAGAAVARSSSTFRFRKSPHPPARPTDREWRRLLDRAGPGRFSISYRRRDRRQLGSDLHCSQRATCAVVVHKTPTDT